MNGVKKTEKYVVEKWSNGIGGSGLVVLDERRTVCAIVMTNLEISPAADLQKIYCEVAESVEWLPRSPERIELDGETVRFEVPV